MNLRGVPQNRPAGGINICNDLDRCRNRCPQQYKRFFDDEIHFNRSALILCLSAESQNLPDQFLCPVAGLNNLINIV